MKKIYENTLFNVRKHLTCSNYLKVVEEGFRYLEWKISDGMITNNGSNINHLIFVIDGAIVIDCSQYGKKLVCEGQLFFIPKGFIVNCLCTKDSQLLIATFNQFNNNCMKLTYESLYPLTQVINYKMDTLPIKPPMRLFIDTVVLYLRNAINCAHIHSMKINEMLMCLRFFYSREELAEFFYPILGFSIDFKKILFDLAPKVKNVKELIDASHFGKTVFYEKFKNEFGDITPKNWLNQRIMEKIFYISSKPNIGVKELADETGFSSVQALQQYCKNTLNSTPTQIIKERKSLR
ncbi:MAG: helix-turn-helix domain-containing protein [Macellibacteroides fermentans]|uniref:helix-turn-helix domain-containing protein n=1 Tax=Macellibacteroides fermentans TaxID=879969 RepID=UPI003AC29D02